MDCEYFTAWRMNQVILQHLVGNRQGFLKVDKRVEKKTFLDYAFV
jgi:hypothetical protein